MTDTTLTFYRAVCEDCDWRSTTVPWERKAQRDARWHNEDEHDGDDTAVVEQLDRETADSNGEQGDE